MKAAVAYFKVLFQNFLGGTEENHEMRQDSRSLDRGSNPESSPNVNRRTATLAKC